MATLRAGPDDCLLDWRQVHEMTGLSRTTAWRMRKAGAFPAPVRVSPGRVSWWRTDLAAWKAMRTSPRAALAVAVPPNPSPKVSPAPAHAAAPPRREPETRSFAPPTAVRPSPRRSAQKLAPGQMSFEF